MQASPTLAIYMQISQMSSWLTNQIAWLFLRFNNFNKDMWDESDSQNGETIDKIEESIEFQVHTKTRFGKFDENGK